MTDETREKVLEAERLLRHSKAALDRELVSSESIHGEGIETRRLRRQLHGVMAAIAALETTDRKGTEK